MQVLLRWCLLQLFALLASLAGTNAAAVSPAAQPWFGLHFVDASTGRGIPLVEARTVNDIALMTDSAGWVAFYEPGLMDREVFFSLSSPGYEYPADGFGRRGVRCIPKAGDSLTIKLQRVNIAERLFRVTGQGIYRDSVLLGRPAPIPNPVLNAGVLGQDSVQAVPYQGRIFWLWGDTNLPNYPLGNFQTTAATSPFPPSEPRHALEGIDLNYFLDLAEPGRVRRMAPLPEADPVWLFGLLTVTDDTGQEALVAHYSRHPNLQTVAEHGLVRFDDQAGIFRRLAKFEHDNEWRFPRGNALRASAEGSPEATSGIGYFYFADPFCHTRVKATWQDLLKPETYEAFAYDSSTHSYAWRNDSAPTTEAGERDLIAAGKLDPAAARYRLRAAGTDLELHAQGGSIAWNPYRQRWILITVIEGGQASPSYLGEVWYAEAEAVSGPWRRAVKIATHPHYSFYNPRQHVFFQEEGGRIIYFEGTYTQTFSGNPSPTPRYDYNQLLYRLDLDDQRLAPARRP